MAKQKNSKSPAPQSAKSAPLNARLTQLLSVAVIIVAGVFFLMQSAQQGSATTVARSTVNGTTSSFASQLLSPNQYDSQFISTEKEHVLIDVRTPAEFASGHIEGAINIPVEEIGSRLSEVPTDKTLVIYCRSGNRSAQATNILLGAGYSGIYDLGGIITWTAQGYPTKTGCETC